MNDFVRFRLGRIRRIARVARERLKLRRDLPRLAYIGALGEQNLGDEGMLEAARRCYPGHTLVSLEMPHIERGLAPLGLSGSGCFQGVILGGGTLISPFWAPHVAQTLPWRLPTWTLGTGAGSSGFDDAPEVDLIAWRDLLPAFRKVGLRGPRSVSTVRALNCDRAEKIGDLALYLALDRPDPAAEPPRILINVAVSRDTTYRPQEIGWQNELELETARLIKQGWTPVAVAMHPSDVAPLEALLERAGGRAASVARPRTVEEFFELAGPCRLALTVRLHAAVLSCCAGVPPLLLGYRDKCLDFMESADLEQWHLDPQRAAPGEVGERIRDLTACSLSRKEMREETLAKVRSLKRSLSDYVDQTRF